MNTIQKGIQLAVLVVAAVAMTAMIVPKAYAQDYTGGCDYCGGGYDSTYTPSYDSTYTPSYDSSYTPSYDSSYYPSYDSSYTPSYDNSYYPSYGSSYYPYDNSYYPSYGFGYNPGVSFSSAPIGIPMGGSAPSSQQQQQSQSSVNANSNTNTNTSSSNSSVSNSGNSVNNNANNVNVTVNVPQQQAPVTPVYTNPVIQYPVQYVFPQQTYQAPYCTISITNNGGYGNNQAVLTWTSSYATSAYISPNVGTVSVSGSRVVYPGSNQLYTMTVYGYNGQSATCQTTYYYTPTYVAPAPAPYVSLTQIPYTGFDLGPVGNTIYWMSLISFALAAGYLMIYFRGGALAVAGNVLRSRRTMNAFSNEDVSDEAKEEVKDEIEADEEPLATANFSLPVTENDRVTTDSMIVSHGEDGVPRLVIMRK